MLSPLSSSHAGQAHPTSGHSHTLFPRLEHTLAVSLCSEVAHSENLSSQSARGAAHCACTPTPTCAGFTIFTVLSTTHNKPACAFWVSGSASRCRRQPEPSGSPGNFITWDRGCGKREPHQPQAWPSVRSPRLWCLQPRGNKDSQGLLGLLPVTTEDPPPTM